MLYSAPVTRAQLPDHLPPTPKCPMASDLPMGLVSLPTPELVAEKQGTQLAVLVFDVVVNSCLAWAAQLVHLLQMVAVHLNLFIIAALCGGDRGPALQLELGRLWSGSARANGDASSQEQGLGGEEAMTQDINDTL